MLEQPVLTSPLPDDNKWDFSTAEGFSLLSTGRNVTWGCRHFERALRGEGNWLGSPCRARPAGNSHLPQLPASASLQKTCSDLPLRSTGLLGRDQEPRPRPTLSSILAFSEGERRQVRTCQGHRRAPWFPNAARAVAASLPCDSPTRKATGFRCCLGPQQHLGLSQLEQILLALGFTVLQDIHISGLSGKDLAPRETPGSHGRWTGPSAKGFGELWRLQKRAMEMKSALLSSCDGKEFYLPVPTALQPLGQQTSCIGLSRPGTKVQSSAVFPFRPRRFMTSA